MTSFILPLVIAAILIPALAKRIPAYDIFIDGAGEGMAMLKSIFPPLLAILSAVSMLDAAGVWDFLAGVIAPYSERIGIPAQIVPLAMIRPLSGSGALGVYSDIVTKCGADSQIGNIASIVMGSTETTFYTMCVYFSQTKVKDSWRILPFALLGDFMGVLLSCWAVKLFY